ncbi:cleavage stimulation factor subunit 50-like [Morus notabilis]|uniref:cleavage stimulation factor subunit 50-like n=1 Tax=Morus notabilis TaxID=981085 RepID=UPI000CED296E|nr:cleavage stimulation factor subunit 50-like [Morus notabilis]
MYARNICSNLSSHNMQILAWFILSCGKDSSVKLWEVGIGRLVKQYPGATQTQSRCQAVFNHTEDFVLCIDGLNNEIVVWDALTAEKVARWPSNHAGAPRWLDRSPMEAAFAVFNHTEDFVLCIDGLNNEIVVWDALTAEKVARWPSNHAGAPRWLDRSPMEAAFVSCGTDKSIRYWKEALNLQIIAFLSSSFDLGFNDILCL